MIWRGRRESVGSRAPTPEVSVGALGAAEIGSGRMGESGGEAGEGVGSHDSALQGSRGLATLLAPRLSPPPLPPHACTRPQPPVRQRAQRKIFRGRRASLGDYVRVGASGCRGVGASGVEDYVGVGAWGMDHLHSTHAVLTGGSEVGNKEVALQQKGGGGA